MNLQTMRLFCEVVRTKSFVHGARAMELTQSAASQTLARLEQHLGTLLIDRSHRPFRLTPNGVKFYGGIRPLLRRYDNMTNEVRALASQVGGTVRVAAIYSIGMHAMSRHIQRFMLRYPQAKVRLEYLRPNVVIESVLSHNVDFGIISFPSASPSLAVIPLRSEKMVFVCSPTHRLASRRGIEAQDLSREDIVSFEHDLPIRRAIDRALRKRQVRINVAMEFDNIENIKQAVESNVGAAILPEPTVFKETESGSLVALPLAMAELVRPIGIIHRKNHYLSPVVVKFIEDLKQPG